MKTNSVIYCFSNPLTPTSAEVLDIALTSVVFDQKIMLVFFGDAVYQLPTLTNESLTSDFGKSLNGLRMMEEFPIYVDLESLDVREIDTDNLPDYLTVTDTSTLKESLRTADLVLNF